MNNPDALTRENFRYMGTGGVSANNRSQGFVPAFKDAETGIIYKSRFANGMPAPVHMLAGLPEELVEVHEELSTNLSLKSSVISGFIREETFYSREEARQATAEGVAALYFSLSANVDSFAVKQPGDSFTP